MTTAQAVGDRLKILIGGRDFGAARFDTRAFEEAVPREFLVLRDELRAASKLLALHVAPELTHDDVFNAYQADVRLLQGRVADLEKTAKLALRCSVKEDEKTAEKTAEKIWGKLQQELPAIGAAPLMRLDADLAAQPATVILPLLQQQAEESIERIPRLFTAWLQLLAERGLIGLAEWTAPSVARYHYFRRDMDREKIVENATNDVAFDDTKPFGEKTTYTTRVDRLIRERVFSERHVHHIIRARSEELEDYRCRVPNSVARLLTELPASVRPYVRIISGEITHEEVLRVVEHDGIVAEHEESVVKGSPAVAIGPFTFAGWSSDDLLGFDGGTWFTGRRAAALEAAAEARVMKRAIPAAVVILAAIIGGIWYWSAKAGAEREAQRDGYIATIRGDRLTTARGEAIPLPPGMLPASQRLVYYHGPGAAVRSHVRLQIVGPPKAPDATSTGMMLDDVIADHTYRLDEGYGDLNLQKELGLPITLRVMRVREGTSVQLEYALVRHATPPSKH